MNATKKSILVVDDNQLIRSIIVDILEGKYTIAGEARNGKDAIKMYQELNPDLVLMDIMMPETNGIEAMKTIIKEDPAAKIIIVSTLDPNTQITEEMREGSIDWIPKPIEEEALLTSIETHIQQ